MTVSVLVYNTIFTQHEGIVTRARDRKGRKSMLYLLFMLKKIAQILVLVYKAQCEFRINFRVKFCVIIGKHARYPAQKLNFRPIWQMCRLRMYALYRVPVLVILCPHHVIGLHHERNCVYRETL